MKSTMVLSILRLDWWGNRLARTILLFAIGFPALYIGLALMVVAGVAGPLDVKTPYVAEPSSKVYRVANAITTGPVVWSTGSMAKVQRDALPGVQQTLKLFAARNEFESFQVHVRSGAAPLQMNVTVGNFVNPLNGAIIQSASSVFLYREAYLNITTLSDSNGVLGQTPDPLIPAFDPYTQEARNAFPFTVPPNQVQSAWVDVLVPQDALPGRYVSLVTVRNGSKIIGRLHVSLKVWDFAIPSTASLKSAFGMAFQGLCIQTYGSYDGCANYPGSGNNSDRAIELMHLAQAKLLLDHRLSISDVVYYGPPTGDWNHFDSVYGPLLDGTAGTLLPGAKITSMRYSSPSYQLVAADIQDWISHFSNAGWLTPLFQYTCDEPPVGCTWDAALQDETTAHDASSLLKTLITTNLIGATLHNLLADLNIIVPVVNDLEPQDGVNQRTQYDSWLSGVNKHIWWYQGCSSHGSCSNGTVGPSNSTWPSYMVDATPVRNRVFQWLAFLDRIEAELYYQIDYCFIYAVCGPNSDSRAPWSSIYAFGGNGDGTLIYPGTPDLIGGSSPIAIPSIRLKLIRDGMEDFEYLNSLSKAGYDRFARSVSATFITNAYTFNNDPAALSNARLKLGNKLDWLGKQ